MHKQKHEPHVLGVRHLNHGGVSNILALKSALSQPQSSRTGRPDVAASSGIAMLFLSTSALSSLCLEPTWLKDLPCIAAFLRFKVLVQL